MEQSVSIKNTMDMALAIAKYFLAQFESTTNDVAVANDRENNHVYVPTTTHRRDLTTWSSTRMGGAVGPKPLDKSKAPA